MPLVLVDLLSYTGTKGGMETYSRELYRELGRMAEGYEFVGFASKELMTMDKSWFPGRIIDSYITGENRFIWAWGELFAVTRAADRAGADLIHSPATLGPMRSTVPTVVTMHDMLYFSHPQYMSTGLYTKPVRWMEKRAAANATRILTISTQSAEDIQKYLHVPAQPDRYRASRGHSCYQAHQARRFQRRSDDPGNGQPASTQKLGQTRARARPCG